MQWHLRGRAARWAIAPLGALGLALAACGTASTAQGHRNAATGTAVVAYAGSLQLVNEKVVGPGFSRRTGYGYQGRGGGSFAVASEIRAGLINPGVFMSVGAAPIARLEPRRTSAFIELYSCPLVVAYNPKSPYAPQLAAIASHRRPLADLFTLMAKPGFRLGRTDPATDPQGRAFIEMVHLAQHRLSLPPATARSVLGAVDNPSQIFAETALDAQLQAGQLDAASAFRSQALQLHLPYISLPPALGFGDPRDARIYAGARVTLAPGQVVHGVPLVVDATVLERANPAAVAFVRYLLSPAGRAAYTKAGYTPLRPRVVGSAAALPAALRHALG